MPYRLRRAGRPHKKSPGRRPRECEPATAWSSSRYASVGCWFNPPSARSPLSAASLLYSTFNAVVLATSILMLGPIVVVKKAAWMNWPLTPLGLARTMASNNMVMLSINCDS